MEDLSRHHQVLTPAFRIAEDRGQFELGEEQVAFFHAHGYVTGVRVLEEKQVELLREELAALMDPAHPRHSLWYEFHSDESSDPRTRLFHALGAWRIERGFHDLLWWPGVTVPAAQLLGGGVRFWHDQLFCKPPHHGGVVAWHQDYSYWTRTRPLAHLTCWIALDDANADNGTVSYVPGSHRWDLLPVTGLAGDKDAIQEVLTDEQRNAFEPVTATLRAGEATFHHPLTVHGSFENRSDHPRRATVVNLCRDGVLSDTDDPLLEGVPPIPRGQPLAGQFFPLLVPSPR